MALKLSPNSPCNRRTSLIRRISDLGLGIIPPLAKGCDDTRDYFRVSRAAPLRRGGENSGLRWRLPSESGGDLDRTQVAISIGLEWRFGPARAPSPPDRFRDRSYDIPCAHRAPSRPLWNFTTILSDQCGSRRIEHGLAEAITLGTQAGAAALPLQKAHIGVRMADHHDVVSHDQWLDARKSLLAKEKEFTRLRAQLSQPRRDLPWERVAKTYVFDGPDGAETLAQLFAGKSQLIVYHFMFPPDGKPCLHCSFWADNFNPVIVHINHRDASMVAISRASYEQSAAYNQRMGWSFKWLSSGRNSFNYDFDASFTPEELGEPVFNFG